MMAASISSPFMRLARGAGMLVFAVWGSSCMILPPHSASHRPRHAQVIHEGAPPSGGTQKWNPVWWLGNADDRAPPAWYRPSAGRKLRAAQWQMRNPMHNFTFYVIGVADQNFIRYGRAPEAVFAPGGGWNWAVIQKGWLRLPFVSYEGKKVRFYALWRERGNFGLKVNVRKP